MTNVIIGHTTHERTRIWLRGDWRHPHARIELKSGDAAATPAHTQSVRLPRRRDYTGVVEFAELAPDTPYTVHASFGPPWWFASSESSAWGRLRTAPAPAATPEHGAAQRAVGAKEGADAFTFLFGSCNLSNIKVNNLLGLIIGMIGSYVITESIRRRCSPPTKDFFVIAVVKRACSFVARMTLGGVFLVTGYRPPITPWVVSPFLRLATLFGTRRVTIGVGSDVPAVGTLVEGECSQATGFVAFAIEPLKSSPPQPRTADVTKPASQGSSDPRPGAHPQGLAATGCDLMLVMTNHRSFQQGERLVWGPRRRRRLFEPRAYVTTAHIVEDIPVEAQTPAPSFMLHVGDQIYFDFPTRDPRPTIRNYRSTYREAWSEDVVAAHFLAQCPQYMTLDDHEIFDNFATDALAPRAALTAVGYSQPALDVYEEYVHRRHPAFVPLAAKCTECGQPLGAGKPLYYTFEHGAAFFFVMDTRTERYSGGLLDEPGRMVSCCQLESLKLWLTAHRRDLVFIVSSVPFVPEVNATADEASGSHDPEEKSVDKWCAPAFTAQREQIIRHIYENAIERVVFLTGDMHCCYHASMKIKVVEKSNAAPRCITIHELASGPIYQLRLSRASNFSERFRGEISAGGKRLAYSSWIHQLYSLANAAMTVSVEAPLEGRRAAITQNVRWQIFQTVGESHRRYSESGSSEEDEEDEVLDDPCAAQPRAAPAARSRDPDRDRDPNEPVMRGQISFHAPMMDRR